MPGSASKLASLSILLVLAAFMYREAGFVAEALEPLPPLERAEPLRVLVLEVVGGAGALNRTFKAGEEATVRVLVQVSYSRFRGYVALRCTLHDPNGEIAVLRYVATRAFQGSQCLLELQIPVPWNAQAGRWLLRVEVVYEGVVKEFEEWIEVV